MTLQIGIVYAMILSVLLLPVFTRLRYDLVSLLGVSILALLNIISAREAFAGFGHPAVVTVAAVLVASRGLQNSGVADMLANLVGRAGERLSLQLMALCGLVAFASAFMNNVGALALFMPVAIRMARQSERSPGYYLMPIAFSAHFGGMITLIGTPPNIIISSFRAEYIGEPLGMFDLAPVGVAVAAACVLFIALVGWRLLPQRKGGALSRDLFTIEDYLSEVRVTGDSPLAGQPVRAIHSHTSADVLIVGILRGDEHLPAPSGFEVIQRGDILLVRANADDLSEFILDAELELAESKPIPEEALESDEISMIEAVVGPQSPIVGRTARNLNLRWRYAVNLLAVSRRGAALGERLGSIRFVQGDVLLLQGHKATLPETLEQLGCLPLARRPLNLGHPRRVMLSIGMFAGAMAASAAGLVPVQLAMVLVACVMMLVRMVHLAEAYEAIDWPIIILLGAMLALGTAMQRTGGAQLIASQLLYLADSVSPTGMLVLVLVVTITLSDLVNNAAAVVLMAPIAVGVASGLGVSLDPFLIAVAIGGSCAFLTPIGHQSNVMVLEPGGYDFGDYWRLGLPLELIIVAVGVPLLLLFWPL